MQAERTIATSQGSHGAQKAYTSCPERHLQLLGEPIGSDEIDLHAVRFTPLQGGISYAYASTLFQAVRSIRSLLETTDIDDR